LCPVLTAMPCTSERIGDDFVVDHVSRRSGCCQDAEIGAEHHETKLVPFERAGARADDMVRISALEDQLRDLSREVAQYGSTVAELRHSTRNDRDQGIANATSVRGELKQAMLEERRRFDEKHAAVEDHLSSLSARCCDVQAAIQTREVVATEQDKRQSAMQQHLDALCTEFASVQNAQASTEQSVNAIRRGMESFRLEAGAVDELRRRVDEAVEVCSPGGVQRLESRLQDRIDEIGNIFVLPRLEGLEARLFPLVHWASTQCEDMAARVNALEDVVCRRADDEDRTIKEMIDHVKQTLALQQQEQHARESFVAECNAQLREIKENLAVQMDEMTTREQVQQLRSAEQAARYTLEADLRVSMEAVRSGLDPALASLRLSVRDVQIASRAADEELQARLDSSLQEMQEANAALWVSLVDHEGSSQFFQDTIRDSIAGVRSAVNNLAVDRGPVLLPGVPVTCSTSLPCSSLGCATVPEEPPESMDSSTGGEDAVDRVLSGGKLKEMVAQVSSEMAGLHCAELRADLLEELRATQARFCGASPCEGTHDASPSLSSTLALCDCASVHPYPCAHMEPVSPRPRACDVELTPVRRFLPTSSRRSIDAASTLSSSFFEKVPHAAPASDWPSATSSDNLGWDCDRLPGASAGARSRSPMSSPVAPTPAQSEDTCQPPAFASGESFSWCLPGHLSSTFRSQPHKSSSEREKSHRSSPVKCTVTRSPSHVSTPATAQAQVCALVRTASRDRSLPTVLMGPKSGDRCKTLGSGRVRVPVL